jgi:hypothetical protein
MFCHVLVEAMHCAELRVELWSSAGRRRKGALLTISWKEVFVRWSWGMGIVVRMIGKAS